uniref:Putative secreted protein n=1 Tax=Ixodes ricinus TaxID=34613 RepID=A0A6B0U568_IXORI
MVLVVGIKQLSQLFEILVAAWKLQATRVIFVSYAREEDGQQIQPPCRGNHRDRQHHKWCHLPFCRRIHPGNKGTKEVGVL